MWFTLSLRKPTSVCPALHNLQLVFTCVTIFIASLGQNCAQGEVYICVYIHSPVSGLPSHAVVPAHPSTRWHDAPFFQSSHSPDSLCFCCYGCLHDVFPEGHVQNAPHLISSGLWLIWQIQWWNVTCEVGDTRSSLIKSLDHHLFVAQ